jgi:hypothetical protein
MLRAGEEDCMAGETCGKAKAFTKQVPAAGAEQAGPGAGFVYDEHARKTRISDRELLAALRVWVGKTRSKRLRVKDFNAWKGRPCGGNTIVQRFGSWRMAMRLIGVEGRRGRNYPARELLETFERVWREMGRAPGAQELARRGGFSPSVYLRRWGSLPRLRALVARHHRGEITREEVLAGCAEGRRVTLSAALRWRVLERDGYRCVVCGRRPRDEPGLVLHLDHIRPVSKGGRNEESNLRTLCVTCNMGRGNGERRGRAA